MPRVVVGIVVAVLALAGVAAAQTSPGPLAAGHAGIARCDGCHTADTALAPAKCLACHVALSARIAAGRGLHAGKLVAGKQCQSCHHEHRGAAYDSTGWTSLAGGRDGFDHAVAGWPLEGAHRLQRCAGCHKTHDAHGLETYLGTSAACNACHAGTQPHKITRAPLLDCGRCHTTRGWKPPRAPLAFDHDRAEDARMPLQGAHAELPCVKCHVRAAFNLQLANPARCDSSSCHAPRHVGQLFGARPCDWCHAAAASSFARVAFDHKARARFELGPSHEALTCEKCHTSALGAKHPPSHCEACHHTAVAYAARSFDHAAHDVAIAGKRAPAIACARCHATTGDPAVAALVDVSTSLPENHARCAGSGCHGAFASTDCKLLAQAGATRVCAACHRGRACMVEPAQPPTVIATRFGHGHHVERGAGVEDACAVCHDASAHGGANPAAPAHKLCAACHGGKAQPAMSTCAGCHAVDRPRALVVLVDDPLHVRARFAHVTHASRVASHCVDCHGVRRAPADDAPVRAAMTAVDPRGTCARCHQPGGTAFSATAHCARCHDEPRLVTGAVAAFSHGAHERRFGTRPFACLACHVLDGAGLVDAMVKGKEHLPCAEAGCHGATDFASARPTLCVICHAEGAPWTQTRRQAQAPEWSTAIDHARHLANPNMACGSCHGDAPAPRSHAVCTPCHARGQPPSMDRCDACHRRTPQARPASAWSVAATFDHATHRIGPRSGAPTACGACHVGVETTATRAAIARPTMATCDACHDGIVRHAGRTVFKTTGFGCVRCHLRR